ncbi:MAG: type II toxin-antitoxin system HicB family antitoxin [Bacteroidota bacterium]
MNRYEVIIFWSEVDEVFVAEIPELKGCMAHGSTQNEALREVNKVAKEWLAIAKEQGWEIPDPKGRLLFA